MSTSVSLPISAISWKQEVNRRIAAHQSRSSSATKPVMPARRQPAAGSRYAQAVARVAARYARASSFCQIEAAGAQPAVDAASPDPQSASAGPHLLEPKQPQAVAPVQLLLQRPIPTFVPAQPAVPTSLDAWESECSRLDGEPDYILRPLRPVPVSKPTPPDSFAPPAEDSWEWPAVADEPANEDDLSPVEPDLPIHANLIEFPRELVAARKRRPLRAEGPFAVTRAQTQLNIFEVDPAAISIEPEAAGAAPAWPSPEWSSIELDAQPMDEPELRDALSSPSVLQQPPFSRRLTAAFVDGALIAGAIMGAALVAAAKIGHPLPAKIAEISAASALLLAGLLYQALFLALAEATPGMKCAGISLCTFDGQRLTRAQSRRRLGALLLSVLPLGLGIAWALFDDDHLCWHDHLSKTYLRKN